MATIVRCEQCRAEVPGNGIPTTWVRTQQKSGPSDDHGIFGDFNFDWHDFCSWACVSEYSTARALIGGSEP